MSEDLKNKPQRTLRDIMDEIEEKQRKEDVAAALAFATNSFHDEELRQALDTIVLGAQKSPTFALCLLTAMLSGELLRSHGKAPGTEAITERLTANLAKMGLRPDGQFPKKEEKT